MTLRPTSLSPIALFCSAAVALAAQSKLDPRNTPGSNRAAPASPAASAAGMGMALDGAHVAADGSLTNDSGATASTNLSTGAYEVDFNRDVSKCFYNATPFSADFTVEVQPRSGNANGVFVLLRTGNTSTNGEFYLTVYCAR